MDSGYVGGGAYLSAPATLMTPLDPAPSPAQELCHKVGFRIDALREAASHGLPRVHSAMRAQAPLALRAAAAADELRSVIARLGELNAAADECLAAVESLDA